MTNTLRVELARDRSAAARVGCRAAIARLDSEPRQPRLMHQRIMMLRCYDDGMRTTLDIPDDLHAQAVAIARDTHQSLSQTISGLIRRGLTSGVRGEIERSARTGLPVVHVSRTITSEDVRRLEDDEE